MPNSQPSAPQLTYTPKTFNALDAKLIQFKYAIYKLEHIISSIDAMLADTGAVTEGKALVLIQYIIHLAPTLFAIHESAFAPKLAALEKFIPIKTTNVILPPSSHHVSYDSRDSQVVVLSELPKPSSSLHCLKSFKSICINCLEGYNKRLEVATKEINNPIYVEELNKLVSHSFEDPANIDVTLSSVVPGYEGNPFKFPIPSESEIRSNGDVTEACLIDIDVHALFVVSKNISILLSKYKPAITNLNKVKTAPKGKQESLLESLPNPGWSLHQVLLWALRLNDLYIILRRFGRQIFLSNHAHLNDPHFVSHMSNGLAFRNQILKSVNDSFNTPKKNGVMIATITRFMRQINKLEIQPKTVLDFYGFIGQSFTLLESACRSLSDLAENWIPAELIFRKNHSLPKDLLIKLYECTDRYKRVREKQAIDKKNRELEMEKEKARKAEIEKKNRELEIEKEKARKAEMEREEARKAEIEKEEARKAEIEKEEAKKAEIEKKNKELEIEKEKARKAEETERRNKELEIEKENARKAAAKKQQASKADSVNKEKEKETSIENSNKAKEKPEKEHNEEEEAEKKKISNDEAVDHEEKEAEDKTAEVAGEKLQKKANTDSGDDQNSLDTLEQPDKKDPDGIKEPKSQGQKSEVKSNILKDDLFLPFTNSTLDGDFDKKAIVTTTPKGRRRSTSQPLPFNQLNKLKTTQAPGSAGNEKNKSGSNESSRSSSPLKTQFQTQKSHASRNVYRMPQEEPEADVPSPTRLSANQKFALHLREATRSGDIMSHQREAMTSVVFDPNNPSASGLRRSVENSRSPPLQQQAAVRALQADRSTTQSSNAPALPHLKSPSPHHASVAQRLGQQEPELRLNSHKQTRAQITKLNTQRNSLASPVSEDEANESFTESPEKTATPESSNSSEVIVKKVRFIGVPQYTPEEDYPTRPANRLIHQFAINKKPYLTTPRVWQG